MELYCKGTSTIVRARVTDFQLDVFKQAFWCIVLNGFDYFKNFPSENQEICCDINPRWPLTEIQLMFTTLQFLQVPASFRSTVRTNGLVKCEIICIYFQIIELGEQNRRLYLIETAQRRAMFYNLAANSTWWWWWSSGHWKLKGGKLYRYCRQNSNNELVGNKIV